MYIVFEGIDGSGKTSITQKLKEFLERENKKVYIRAEPFDRKFIEETFEKVKKIKNETLKNVVITLAFAYDRAFLEDEFKEKKGVIIGDRSFISSLAYQGLDLPLDYVFNVNKFFELPDCVFYLDVNPEIALERIEKRGEKRSYYEKIEYLNKIRENYKRVLDYLKKKGVKVFYIDANKEFSEVFKEVLKRIKEFC